MNAPRDTECIVRGSLALVLRISQIAGVAPLRFKRRRDGWSVRVSPIAYCYGRVLLLILCFLATSTLAVDMYYHPERSYRTNKNSNRIIWVSDLGVVGLVMCTGGFTALQRMRCLIVCLLELQKVNSKLNLLHRDLSNEWRRIILITSLMSLLILNTSVDSGIIINHVNVVTDYKKVFISSIMCLFYSLMMIIVEIILIQISQIVVTVLSSLNMLNNCLKSLLQEVNNSTLMHFTQNAGHKSINTVMDTDTFYRGPTNVYPKAMSITVRLRRVSLLYCSVCEVMRQINDSHGAVLVALLFSLLIHLVITPYNSIISILNDNGPGPNCTTLQVSWALLHFSNLLLIIEPCHQTHEAIDVTKHLICQMTRVAPLHDDSLIYELEMFYRHMILNEVTYSPLKMVLLNRKLIVTILGNITTYLVVIIQLRSQR